MKSELLAPARDKNIAKVAIDCGADAVYIGPPSFGARKNACNSLEDIEEVVHYAHKFWAKVYVTLNTILTDLELDYAISLVYKLEQIGVDALIIQDFGLLKKIIDIQEAYKQGNVENNITIPLHMSTQCDNRDVEKIKFYDEMGISRSVLARELSLKQIEEIHKTVPNMEIEAFVHGALCVCYSGQCYLSQYIGGRSANRGECAQPCRKKYSVVDSDGNILAKDIYALCLKDFNASNKLEDMLKAGVFSFKIEGRLKDVNYVKNITSYYRQELDKYSEKISSGKSFISFIPNPEKSFNRGFTEYFLEKREECYNFLSPKSRGEYLGKVIDVKGNSYRIKTNKKIGIQDGITDGVVGFLVNKIENGYICPNKKIHLKIGDVLYRNLDFKFEKELSLPAKRQIGISILIDNRIIIEDEDRVQVCSDIPIGEKPKDEYRAKEVFKKQFSKTGDSDFYVQSIEIASEIPFLPISVINELRRNLLDSLLKKRISLYKKEHLDNLKYAKYYKQELDYRANVHNNCAKSFYAKSGACVKELSLESSNKHCCELELMRTKHCIKYALGICKNPKKIYLLDECNYMYPLNFDCKNCEMILKSK